jgi:hypothetical protein
MLTLLLLLLLLLLLPRRVLLGHGEVVREGHERGHARGRRRHQRGLHGRSRLGGWYQVDSSFTKSMKNAWFHNSNNPFLEP